VWRLIVQPVRSLVRATRCLAEGDFAARARMNRNDEISRSHHGLVLPNERLEPNVAERTYELEAANTRLREEMAEKEDFLRAVSHDLNAPLRNIAGMATIAMIKYPEEVPEEVLTRLGPVEANVDVETR
jgi:signal transduction histidine kinase